MVREACRRTLGKRHYDVQLLGGIVLHQGSIAEMKTGEGKTFVAALPLYLHALTGRGAHLVTPNDYLSKVGLQLMGPIYHLLGASAAVIQNQGGGGGSRQLHLRSGLPHVRRQVPEPPALFPPRGLRRGHYLRHQQRVRLRLPARQHWPAGLDGKVQRELHYAIVDEVDNILIDEARTPLIISGVARDSSSHYQRFASLVRQLQAERDYTVAEKERTVTLTEAGIERMETALGIDNLYGSEHAEMLPYLDNALRASVLYRKDVEYLVKGREVVIVDEFTGRMMEGPALQRGPAPGHRGQGRGDGPAGIDDAGQHHVPEPVPHVPAPGRHDRHGQERKKRNCGASTTSTWSPSPTHKPVIRDDRPDVVYKTKDLKFRQVVAEIKAEHEAGRPVLVGTVAVETSEQLSRQLRRARVPHEVLNAKNHEREATIIAQAGRRGCRNHRHQHGGTRRGHPAGRQSGRPGPRPAAAAEGGPAVHTPRRMDPGCWICLIAARNPRAASADEWVDTVAEVHRQVEQEQREVLALGGLHVGQAPSATNPAASTTSCAAAPDASAIPAAAGSTSAWRTTCCFALAGNGCPESWIASRWRMPPSKPG